MKTEEKRVRWTEAELALLAKGCFEALTKALGQKLLWQVLASDEVQNLLPPNRRRKITGSGMVSEDLQKMVQDMMSQVLLNQEPVIMEVPVTERITIREKPEETLMLVSDHVLMAEVARRVALLMGSMASLRVLQVERPISPGVKDAVAFATEPTPKHRIVLVGFLADQASAIQEKTKGFDTVEVFSVDTKGSKVKSIPQADWCILFSKVSHAQAGRADKSTSGRVIRVTGTTLAVKEIADIHSRLSSHQPS